MNQTPPSGDGNRRLVTCLVLCAAASLWIDLGTLHRWHHGDSIIMVLISLLRWTPFAWEQDRHGMLIPLLARPVTSPFGNLLVQGFWDVFFGLAVFFLLAHYMLRSALAPWVAAAGVAAFLLLTPAYYRFDYFLVADSGVWLSVGLVGLLLAEPATSGCGPSWGRRGLALALIVVTHWVSCAAALYLGALVVCRAVSATTDWRRVRDEFWPSSWSGRDLRGVALRVARAGPVQAFVMLAVGYQVGMMLSDLAPVSLRTSFDALPVRSWPASWGSLFRRTWDALAPGAWPCVLGAAAVLVPLLAPRRVGEGRPVVPWRPAAALLAAALALALFTGTRYWVKINNFEPRYLDPPVLFAQSALTMLAVVPLVRGSEVIARVRTPVVVGALLFVSAAVSYGWPSPSRVRADLDRRLGALTPDILAERCTCVAGDYWAVWPAVYHANLVLHERGERRVVLGISLRSQPTRPQIQAVPRSELCVAVPNGDPLAKNWMASYCLPRMAVVRQRATIRVLRPASEVAPGLALDPDQGQGREGPVEVPPQP